jgi:hypothetical protein
MGALWMCAGWNQGTAGHAKGGAWGGQGSTLPPFNSRSMLQHGPLPQGRQWQLVLNRPRGEQGPSWIMAEIPGIFRLYGIIP